MNSTTEEKYWWLAEKYFDQLRDRSRAQVALESGVLVLIATTALSGNALLLLAIIRNRSLRTTTNALILCLALSDIASAALHMPLSLIPLMTGRWITAINQYDVKHFACKLQATLVASLIAFSLHMMAATAVNRYTRVLKPDLCRKMFSKKSVAVFAVIDYVLMLVLFTWPSAAGSARYTFDPRRCSCFLTFYDVGASEIVARIYTAVNMGGSLVIMAYCYARVFREIRRHQRSVASSFQAPRLNARTNVEDVKATRVAFAVFLGFVGCWIPVVVLDTLSYQLTNPRLPREAELFLLYCSSLSSAINPIIYGFMNRAIRKEFGKMLRCWPA